MGGLSGYDTLSLGQWLEPGLVRLFTWVTLGLLCVVAALVAAAIFSLGASLTEGTPVGVPG